MLHFVTKQPLWLCRLLSQCCRSKVLVPPNVNFDVFRGAVAMGIAERKETRYALLAEEHM